MVRRTFLLATLAAAALVLLPAAGAPAGTTTPTGARIGLFAGDAQTFPAGEPFYVDHYTDSTDQYPLLVDRFWGFEFPEGLSGTHTFTGTWSAPCAVQAVTEPTLICDNPTEPTVVLTKTITVVFEPPAAAAAAAQQPAGTKLGFAAGAFQTFPESTPFYFRHGWGVVPQRKYGDLPGTAQALAAGRYLSTLSVDGNEIAPTFVDRYTDSTDAYPLVLWRFWGFEFPQGMTGTHTFTGRWYAPCAAAQVDVPSLVCDTPSEPVLYFERTTTVLFTRTTSR